MPQSINYAYPPPHYKKNLKFHKVAINKLRMETNKQTTTTTKKKTLGTRNL